MEARGLKNSEAALDGKESMLAPLTKCEPVKEHSIAIWSAEEQSDYIFLAKKYGRDFSKISAKLGTKSVEVC